MAAIGFGNGLGKKGDFIAKPFLAEDLFSRIDKLLKQSSGNLSILPP